MVAAAFSEASTVGVAAAASEVVSVLVVSAVVSVCGAGIKSRMDPCVEYGAIGAKPPGLNRSPPWACASGVSQTAVAMIASRAVRVLRNVCVTAGLR